MHINRFKTHINGVARQNRFEVDIFCPAIQLRMRSMRCQKATMPGKTLELSSFNKIPGGYADHVVKGIKYDENVILSFLLDDTFEDRQKIELWQQYIYNEDYSIRYPKEGAKGYVGTVIIRQLDTGGNTIYEVELTDAFPTVLGALTLDMASSAVQTFDVTFTYRTWYSSYSNTPSDSILGGLFKKHSRRIGTKIRRKVEDKLFG
tara:strand:+ start:568 stop:1182 length:615 start_codon:yes stop_codon:yes gene_type:complete